MVNFKLGSLNCRGLSSNNIKRRDFFGKYRENYDVTFLIDTHCVKNVEQLWTNEWGYKAVYNSYKSNSRGVAILFRNSFQYELINEIKDNSGNFLILEVKINEVLITFVALQPYIRNADIGYAYKSDHSSINLTIEFIDQIRGRGSWKFNNSLLYDSEYVSIIKQCITQTLEQYKVSEEEGNFTYSINDQLLWETLKIEIRGKTISYSSFKKRNRDKKEKEIEAKLLHLYREDISNKTQEIDQLENELKKNKK